MASIVVSNKLAWRGTTNGQFNVKSAYHLSMQMRQHTRGETSLHYRFQHLWKRIWSLRAPLAMKVFMWRACVDTLPTKFNLVKKHIVQDAFFPICLRKI